MPSASRNLQWYRYVDDNSINRAIMADNTWGANAASGLVAFVATDTVFGPQSRTHRTRKVIYKDPVTLRIVKHPVGTAAAFAALPATLAVFVPGLATTVTYDLAQKLPERQRIPGPSYNKGEHP